MSRALFLVDLQHAQFFGPRAVPEAPQLLHRIGSRLLEARQAGLAVFHIQNDGPEGESDSPGMTK